MRTRRAVGDPSDSEVRHYAGLPYHVTLAREGPDDERPWRAQVEELPDCASVGASAVEAVAGVSDAIAEWVTAALTEGREIPEPRSARSYSGKLLLRMPLSLHAELAHAAERDQVSLNAYIVAQLAVALRGRTPADPPAQRPTSTRGQAIWWALLINLAVVSIAALVVLAIVLVGADGH